LGFPFFGIIHMLQATEKKVCSIGLMFGSDPFYEVGGKAKSMMLPL
jgi:hypothetical protein